MYAYIHPFLEYHCTHCWPNEAFRQIVSFSVQHVVCAIKAIVAAFVIILYIYITRLKFADGMVVTFDFTRTCQLRETCEGSAKSAGLLQDTRFSFTLW